MKKISVIALSLVLRIESSITRQTRVHSVDSGLMYHPVSSNTCDKGIGLYMVHFNFNVIMLSTAVM